MATWAVLLAAGALMLNFVDKVFGGGWKLSNRLTKLETLMIGMQSEIANLVDTMKKLVDVRGDLRVIDTKLAAMDTRVTAVEQDMRELRHGDGFVRGSRGIEREYP